jgi:hypothetical protein
MVQDEKTSGMRKMTMGDLSLEPCPNDYKCEGCNIEGQFMEDIKKVIKKFRNKFAGENV